MSVAVKKGHAFLTTGKKIADVLVEMELMTQEEVEKAIEAAIAENPGVFAVRKT